MVAVALCAPFDHWYVYGAVPPLTWAVKFFVFVVLCMTFTRMRAGSVTVVLSSVAVALHLTPLGSEVNTMARYVPAARLLTLVPVERFGVPDQITLAPAGRLLMVTLPVALAEQEAAVDVMVGVTLVLHEVTTGKASTCGQAQFSLTVTLM